MICGAKKNVKLAFELVEKFLKTHGYQLNLETLTKPVPYSLSNYTRPEEMREIEPQKNFVEKQKVIKNGDKNNTQKGDSFNRKSAHHEHFSEKRIDWAQNGNRFVEYPQNLVKQSRILARFPRCLPQNKGEAIQAIRSLLDPFPKRFNRNEPLLNLYKEVIRYFDSHEKSPTKKFDFQKYFHLLATLIDRASSVMSKHAIKLEKIKRVLPKLSQEKLDSDLYGKVASIYESIVTPPHNILKKMIAEVKLEYNEISTQKDIKLNRKKLNLNKKKIKIK